MCWKRHPPGSWRTFSRCESGQATVESALLLPVLLAVILVLVQPGIVLYDRIVMRDAAAQGARVLITQSGGDDGTAESFIRRRLGSVPQTDSFHIHRPGACSWEIECAGGASSGEVTVTIGNDLKPLPLIGFGAGWFGILDGEGNLHFEVSVTMPVQDGWVATSGAGADPGGWIGVWLDE
ncbi:MAG: pilus assembly protein [Eggerthellaceae bacterium]|nr:pilus assembly protein [Eggerthellaceae bacterium]